MTQGAPKALKRPLTSNESNYQSTGISKQMADFTAKDVQNLRQLTGAGMMDAKALVEKVATLKRLPNG